MIEALSPHHNPRPFDRPPSAVIVHTTGSATAASALAWFQDPEAKVSCHVLIDRDGTTYRVVEDRHRAWHAGLASLHGVGDVNSYSLGVELVDPETPGLLLAGQWAGLLTVVADWVRRYRIPLNRVVGHCHVAPGRKVDPVAFDWYAFLREVGAAL